MGDVNAQDMQLLVIGDWVEFLVIGDHSSKLLVIGDWGFVFLVIGDQGGYTPPQYNGTYITN